jgi:hypothetical protein
VISHKCNMACSIFGVAIAALIAPEPGFAGPPTPAAASSVSGNGWNCVPPNLQFPGSGAFEPWAVFFDLGSARITPQATAVLKNAATVYRQFPKCALLLEAHTDSMEAASYAADLAAKRANAIIRFLRRRGVTMRTCVEAYGDTHPLVDTPKGAAELQNRRVLFLLDPGTCESKP